VATTAAATTATTTTATTTTIAATTTASTQLSALAAQQVPQHSVLIIDPHLPDPTPRLPGWQLPASVTKVGWDKDNWPLIYRDAKDAPIPWALGEDDWRPIDLKVEKVFTEPSDVPANAAPPTRAKRKVAATTTAPTTTTTAPATTTATTQEATTQASATLDPKDFLLAVGGDHYYNGRDALVVEREDGSVVTWPLPAAATGATAKPILLRTRDGLLFLVNAPGRIARIRPTPDGAEPFDLEAVFTRTIPSDANPLRVWLDPADRICYAVGSRITILFPIGRIPPQIGEKMRPEDFPTEER
jgi:hypothetical protein